MDPRRWTMFTFASPGRYVPREEFWQEFDLHSWADEDYEWTEDPWNGYFDFAQHPRDTVSRGRGDCEDFALVALAWAAANGREGLGLAFCWEWPYPWPRHVIAFDDERVYSSGNIRECSVEEWVEDSDYRFALRSPGSV